MYNISSVRNAEPVIFNINMWIPIQATPTTNFLIGEGEDGVDGGPPTAPTSDPQLPGPTESQYAFGKLVLQSINRLFQYLEVSPMLNIAVFQLRYVSYSLEKLLSDLGGKCKSGSKV